MNYAILRVQKLKTNTAVRGSLRHAFREQNTPNADPSKDHENSHIGAGSVDEAMKAYKARLPEKVRKNGVRCVEYLMTASPEKMTDMSRDEQDAYFKDSLDWLKEKHGSENVVYSGIHRDETTPHMYAYVVPLSQEKDQEGKLVKPGKLNCREFLGGAKHVLSDLQTEFAERVGKEHGMDRGVKGSKAKHPSIKKYSSNLNKSTETQYDLAKPRLLKKGVFVNKIEKKEDIIDRLSVQSAGLLREVEENKRHEDSARKTFKNLSSQIKELQPVMDLNRSDRERILSEAKRIKLEKDAARRRETEVRRRKQKDQSKGR